VQNITKYQPAVVSAKNNNPQVSYFVIVANHSII
jgi:hypothetical protein